MSYDITSMWNLKRNNTNEHRKQKHNSDSENELLVARGGRGDGGKDWETGICRYKLVYRGWINKVLLYRTWKYIWYPVVTALFKLDNQQGPTVQHRALCSMLCGSLDGRGDWGRMDTCICMAESLHCPPETITTWLAAILQYKIKS